MVRVVALDFDGVILESAEIKTDAFRELFRSFPEHRRRIVDLHLHMAGISRIRKFELIYRDILRRPLGARAKRRLGRRFARIVFSRVLKAPFVPGAEAFLKRFSGCYPLYVVSGTPQTELAQIVRRRGMDVYFTGVYGAPREKPALLRLIARRHGCPTCEVLYVGDGRSDLEGARAAGARFVARVRSARRNPFRGLSGFPRVRDLAELARRWPSLPAASGCSPV